MKLKDKIIILTCRVWSWKAIWSKQPTKKWFYWSVISAICFFFKDISQWKLTCIWHGCLSPALFLVIGLVLYPAGWGNEIVDELCTRKPIQKPGCFVLNDCTLGWAFYAVLGGTLSSFLCSLLSAQAEKSTSTDEVQDEISDGKTFICLI